jgi:hypothetical protein
MAKTAGQRQRYKNVQKKSKNTDEKILKKTLKLKYNNRSQQIDNIINKLNNKQ